MLVNLPSQKCQKRFFREKRENIDQKLGSM